MYYCNLIFKINIYFILKKIINKKMSIKNYFLILLLLGISINQDYPKYVDSLTCGKDKPKKKLIVQNMGQEVDFFVVGLQIVKIVHQGNAIYFLKHKQKNMVLMERKFLILLKCLILIILTITGVVEIDQHF